MVTTTLSGKKRVQEILNELPDDSTFVESLQELVLHRRIELGIEDADAGRLIGHEEVGRRIQQWRK